MKPAVAKATEPSPLEELGQATLEIVHDLKNQLNGLKLYATYLRKRLDRDDRSREERETIAKLIAGLDRAAAEITVLVRYAHPFDLKQRARVDLRNLFESFSHQLAPHAPAARADERQLRNGLATESLYGSFDSEALSEAFRAITEQALAKGHSIKTDRPSVCLQRSRGKFPEALIEWRGLSPESRSSSLQSLDGRLPVRLALAAKIIEAHGGRIEYRGETFRVWLPLSE